MWTLMVVLIFQGALNVPSPTSFTIPGYTSLSTCESVRNQIDESFKKQYGSKLVMATFSCIQVG